MKRSQPSPLSHSTPTELLTDSLEGFYKHPTPTEFERLMLMIPLAPQPFMTWEEISASTAPSKRKPVPSSAKTPNDAARLTLVYIGVPLRSMAKPFTMQSKKTKKESLALSALPHRPRICASSASM